MIVDAHEDPSTRNQWHPLKHAQVYCTSNQNAQVWCSPIQGAFPTKCFTKFAILSFTYSNINGFICCILLHSCSWLVDAPETPLSEQSVLKLRVQLRKTVKPVCRKKCRHPSPSSDWSLSVPPILIIIINTLLFFQRIHHQNRQESSNCTSFP